MTNRGLRPAISIDQKGPAGNRARQSARDRDLDHLRLLFARGGHPHARKCGREIERQSVQQIVDQVADGGNAVLVSADNQGTQDRGDRISRRAKAGLRPRASRRRDLRPERGAEADKYKRHTIEVVRRPVHVRRAEGTRGGRATIGPPHRTRPNEPVEARDRPRLADSIGTALRLGAGVVLIAPAPREGEARVREAASASAYSCQSTARDRRL